MKKSRRKFPNPKLNSEYELFLKEFGENLKLIHQSIPQRELDEFHAEMGFGKSTIWYWEKGKTETKLFYIIKLCERFDLDLKKLVLPRRTKVYRTSKKSRFDIISDSQKEYYSKTAFKKITAIIDYFNKNPEFMDGIYKLIKDRK
ncbi:MAG: helix-turn-helix domain-containing protein [Candidatus Zixiibacteriota bacterium]